MIGFSRMSLWERVKRAVSPSYRARRDAEMREALRELVKNPGLPCIVEGQYIPNGYGHYSLKFPWEV